MRFSDAQIDLYSRQIILREVGGTGQEKLLAARAWVAGRGAARDAALSYLVGAGVARLDLDEPASDAALPLAALASRTPDALVRVLDDVAPSLEAYDLALWFARPGPVEPPPRLPAGRPARGSVAVSARADGNVDVVLLPRDAGCFACVDIADAAADGGRRAAAAADRNADASAATSVATTGDAPVLALAGTLAALACCRWLLDLAAAEDARRLRLDAAGATWLESSVTRRPSCPRGCPPPTERL